MSKKGKLIVFEGLDGCGKDTQIKLLAERMPSTIAMNNIGDDILGSVLRTLLGNGGMVDMPDEAITCLYASNLYSLCEKIKVEVDKGNNVIMGRWASSTLAYLPKSTEYIKSIYKDLPITPDITFFLDVDPEICLERIAKRGNTVEHFEKLDTLNNAREMYLEMDKHINLGKYIKIDSTDKSDTHARVWSTVALELLPNKF